MARGHGRILVAILLLLALASVGPAASAGARHAVTSAPANRPAMVPGRLIVSFRRDVARAGRRAALARAGTSAVSTLGSPSVMLVSVKPQVAGRALGLLRGDARVRFAEPDTTVSIDADAQPPDDALFGKQWALRNTGQLVDFSFGTPDADIDALRAWGVTTGSDAVTVAVIDTGVDTAHPDLAPNVWLNPGENCAGCRTDGIDNDANGYVDDWRGWDFVNNDNDPFDDNGHGTHVAGTIGAVGDNGIGVAGVSWHVKLMPLKFIGADGTGDVAGAVRAVRYATAMGARVSNNSWGGDEYSQALADAIAEADAAGSLFVAAAGNEGSDNDASPSYPAGYDLPNVISVAASDANDQIAYFSNYGRATVDLAAPGQSIYSTWPGNGYRSLSGTSMAAPQVTGTAALAVAAHPGAGAASLKALLLRTVAHPSGVDGQTATGGRLDAGAALACSGTTQVTIDAPGSGFVAAAGHPLTVRLLAGVCGSAAGVTVAATANGQPISLAARGDGLFTGSYLPSASGSITILATATAAGGSDSASVSGTVPRSIVAGGSPVTVTSSAGENAILVFEGVVGGRAAVQIASATFSVSTVTVRAPDGSVVGSVNSGPSGAFLDTFTITQPGTYQIVVDPLSATAGSMTLQLLDVPPDASAAITPGGPAVNLATVPGQNAVATFAGVAGGRIALAISSPLTLLKTSILKPDGAVLSGPLTTGSSGGWMDTVRLPLDGTYTILTDPQGGRAGPITLTLYEVPPDVTAPITAGGASVTLNVTAPGQNALATFTGLAGGRVSLSVSSAVSLLRTSILNPDGSVLSGPATSGGGTTFLDPRTLTQTGTYTVVADPQDVRTGSATLTLYDVPPDPRVTLDAGGQTVSATTTAPGQNAVAQFQGTAGRRVSVTLAATGISSGTVTLLRPNGSALATASIGTSGGFVDAVSLPVDGSYTLLVDPSGAAIGTVTLRLYAVPGDSAATGVLGGGSSTLSTTVPGQNAVLSFSSTAGRRISIRVAGSGLPTTRLDLRQPNGSLVTTFYVSAGGGFMDTRSLPAAGDYTLSVDPSGGATVTITVTLFDVPPDAFTTTVPGGSPASLSITVPGQNGSIGFPGAAGQRISLQVATSMSARFVLLAPGGSTVKSVVAGGSTFVDVMSLPVAGPYTLVFDPLDANTGPATVAVNDVPADVAGSISIGGPPLTISMPVPGEGGSIAFDSTAGRAVKLNLTGVTVSIMRVSVIRADGSVVVPATVTFSGSKTIAFTTPVSGGYRIVLDPYEAATGAATLALS
jgi:subtilisin family serine protease